ncbi:hypothetical protein, partial [Ferrovum myxofaciens]
RKLIGLIRRRVKSVTIGALNQHDRHYTVNLRRKSRTFSLYLQRKRRSFTERTIKIKSGVKLKGSLFCIVQMPQQTFRFFGTGSCLTEILPF